MFETGSFTDSELTSSGRLPPISISLILKYRFYLAVDMGAGNTNSVPHASVANILSVESFSVACSLYLCV